MDVFWPLTETGNNTSSISVIPDSIPVCVWGGPLHATSHSDCGGKYSVTWTRPGRPVKELPLDVI